MKYCIIIRGPAGIGKTTVAKCLSKLLGGFYISYDEVMKENNLDNIEGDGISTENFIKANEIIIAIIKNKNIVILDGCFYRKKQIEHLLKELSEKVYIFSLVADLKECLSRNRKRDNKMTDKSIIDVYNLVSKIDIGTKIKTDQKTVKQVVDTINSKLNNKWQ